MIEARRYVMPPLRRACIGGRYQAWREAGPRAPADRDRLPLVLLHGIGSNARVWAAQFTTFAPERRVLAWNAPGYSGSDLLDGDPRPSDYADALWRWLDTVRVDRCVFVGQSLGAVMAVAAALSDPSRVAGMALASPASGYAVPEGGPLPSSILQRIELIQHLGPKQVAAERAHRLLTEAAGPEARRLVTAAMSELVPPGYAQACRLLAHADLPSLAARLDVPVIVVWGSQDQITPPAACARVARAVPGARHVELHGAGHAAMVEVPDLFDAAIAPLLARADEAGGKEWRWT